VIVRLPTAASAGPRCPVCRKPSMPATRPFCSVRCADVDLGRWLTEQYRIPASPADSDDDPPSLPEDDPGAA
jgi:endogenous inhibitor of DNA gyrase (YacG/DUF329 family)